jgi:hypothetical protein
MGELQFWVRTLRQQTARSFSYFPQGCRHLCHDECMALSALAAAQSKDLPAGELALRQLLGNDSVRDLAHAWVATESFARALAGAGQPLYPVTVAVIQSIVRMQSESARTGKRLN